MSRNVFSMKTESIPVTPRIEQRGSNETAKRSLGVIRQVLDYAVAIGHGTINPAHSLKRHAPVKQTTSHYPCIAWSEPNAGHSAASRPCRRGRGSIRPVGRPAALCR